MSDTTSIDDLPTDPSTGNQNNIIIQKTEMNNGMRGGGGMGGMVEGAMMSNQVMPPAQVYSPNVAGVNMMGGGMGMQMPMQQPQYPQQGQGQGQGQGHPQQGQQQPNVINELVNGLQRASASGLTNLPSRDIPMNTSGMMNDAQVKPNYVPNNYRKEDDDYIGQHEDEEETNEARYNNHVASVDSMENIYKLIQVPLLVGILYFAFQLPVFRKYMLKYIPSIFSGDGNYNIRGLVFVSALFGAGYFGLTRVLDTVAV
jgi:hypothetical protein